MSDKIKLTIPSRGPVQQATVTSVVKNPPPTEVIANITNHNDNISLIIVLSLAAGDYYFDVPVTTNKIFTVALVNSEVIPVIQTIMNELTSNFEITPNNVANINENS